MMTHARFAAVAFTLAALLPVAAYAHRTWMLPSATLLSGKEALVSVDAAVSEDLFEFDTVGLGLDGLVITAPDGTALTADNRSTARRRNSFDVKLTQSGTYRIANVTENVVATYKQGSENKRWRGTPEAYASFLKELPAGAQELRATRMHSRVETFVTYEKPEGRAFTAVGVGLELMPQTPPTDLSVGDTSSFVLLLDGKPAVDLDVTVLRGGNRYRYKMGEITVKTDGQGRFSVKWPEAGRYWISASQGRRPGDAVSEDPAQPARRTGYNATVEVLPQ
jgi:uncharacterized GH25 family protein